MTATIDFAVASTGWLSPTDKTNQIYSQYRVAYDLSKVSEQDIVLVGDSFVWGAGVPIEQRFGNVLERQSCMHDEGRNCRVYSLGILGVGLQTYIKIIQDVPASLKVRQLVVAFYANDMPPRVNLQNTLQQVAVRLGQSSVTLRVVADAFRIAVTPTAEEYAELLLTHFDENEKTFDFRWHQLEMELRELFQLAAERSRQRPVLVVLPMLIDFEKAVFDAPLHRISELAERIGFRVVETMPSYRADGDKAEHYRAAPNDLHLNERGNRIVADVLLRTVNDVSAAKNF